MRKGKHVKPGSYAKPKFKKSLLFVMFSVILLSIIFNNLNQINNEESIAQLDESANLPTTEVTTEPVPEPQKQMEPMEDENLKLLIESNIC